jgi:hypothetical protein
LNWNAEERAATRRPSMRVSPLISSSAMPSQKYSWSFPGLMSDRDLALQARVAGPVHLAHAACAERVDDQVRADLRAGREGHGGDKDSLFPSCQHSIERRRPF